MIHNTHPINLTMWHDKTTKSEKGLHYVGTSHCSASYSLQLMLEKREKCLYIFYQNTFYIALIVRMTKGLTHLEKVRALESFPILLIKVLWKDNWLLVRK